MDERLLDEVAELKRAVEEVQFYETGGLSFRDLLPVYEAAKRVIKAYDEEQSDG